MGKRLLVGGSVAIVVGICLVVLGGCLNWVIFPAVVEYEVYKNLDLREGTEGWKAWVEPPVPVYMCFNFLNVDDPVGVALGGNLTVFETGPYCFREDRLKRDILELSAEHLQYSLYLAYHYDQDETERQGCNNDLNRPCSPDDEVTILNVVLAAIGQLLQDALPVAPEFINKILKTVNDGIEGKLEDCGEYDCQELQDDLFTTASIIDLTFKGVPSGSLKALKHALNVHGSEGIWGILGIDEVELPGEFYFFMGKNGTKMNSYYTINNGRYTRNKFLEIEKFNGETTLKNEWWPKVGPNPSATAAGMGGICHEILGTDGTQFPAYVDKRERRWIFVGEMCRSIWLDYVQDTQFLGIDAYEYRASEDVFDMDNPNNFCYCPNFLACMKINDDDTYDRTNCANTCKDGMIRVGECYGGVPVVMTAPHFFRGDQSMIDDVEGMEPKLELHDTVLLVEPMSGAPLMAHKRIQINLDLKSVAAIDKLKNVKDILFPVFWADETAGLTQEYADLYQDTFVFAQNLILGISIAVGFVLGGVLFIAGIWMCWKG